MSIKTSSIKTQDNHMLAYDIQGRGEPLVLIHGWTLDRRMWANLIPYLNQHFMVISYDRRGCGQSSGVPDLRKGPDDLDALLDHLSIDRAALLGMSQGGRLALRYSLTRPTRVKALILQGSPLDGFIAQAKFTTQNEHLPLDHYSNLIKSGQLDQFRKAWSHHPMMQYPQDNITVKQQITAMLNTYRGKDLEGNITEQTAFTINVAENLNTVKTPVLILEGEHETTPLKHVADKLMADIDNIRRVIIPGGGHLICMIEPQACADAIIRFLHDHFLQTD